MMKAHHIGCLLLFCSTLSARPLRSHQSEAAASGKLELWRGLLSALLGLETGELLAERLAFWPNQRKAALFYLELLARRFRSTGDNEATTACLRSSLAELEADESSFLLSKRHELAELALAQVVALERVEPSISRASQLAVELANLVSRLAVQPASEFVRNLAAERDFLRYLLDSKLANRRVQYKSNSNSNSNNNNNNNYYNEEEDAHSIGIALFKDHEDASGKPEWAWLATSQQANGIDLREHPHIGLGNVSGTSEEQQQHFVSPANGYFNTGIQGETGNSMHVHMGQPFLLYWLQAARTNSLKHLERKLTRGEPLKVRDGRWFSPYFDCGLANRWLLTYSMPLFAQHWKSGAPSEQTAVGGAKFRGVAFVTLDFGKLKLIDQCREGSGEEARGFFLGNTHECTRLRGSQLNTHTFNPPAQCVPLADLSEGGVRAGTYACQCPRSGSVARNQMLANANFRRNSQLSVQEPLISRSLLSKWLLLETPDGSGALENRTSVGNELLRKSRRMSLLRRRRPNNNNSNNNNNLTTSNNNNSQLIMNKTSLGYFDLGAQLEADAALALLLGQQLEWPVQVCATCTSTPKLEKATINSTLTSSAEDDTLKDTTRTSCVEQQLQYPTTWSSSNLANNFLRPLVLTVQLLGSFVSILLAGLLLRLRKSRIILASGWLMLETMLIGALLLYSSVLARYFQASSITCLLEPWLRELGFSIFYGSILIKLYRILTEFQTRKAHRVCLRDKDQMVYLLAIVLIVTGYMGAWTALMLDGFFYRAALVAEQHEQQINLDQQAQQESTSINRSSMRRIEEDEESTGLLSQLAEFAPAQVKLLEQSLNSFANLFSGLLEQHEEQQQDQQLGTDVLFSYSMRCRKLTWDYVTELSEMALLLFGIYLIYKLRNASSDNYKEKLVLSAAVFIELLVSGLAYILKHAFWSELNVHQILLLYCLRCQLTVTPTIALVFGPKLWTIGKSKPTLFRFGGSRAGAASGNSMRHRCHISCELHDHHLNDAVRLHQAMLSNAALDFGSINLADMDPDEIQAELKRVYAQLEILKTKAMRKDNPHISKRRGGRKTGHRKFSLQAFHAKHLGHHHHAPAASSSTTSQQGTGNQQQAISGPLDEKPEEEAAQESEKIEKSGELKDGTAKHRRHHHHPHHHHHSSDPNQQKQQQHQGKKKKRIQSFLGGKGNSDGCAANSSKMSTKAGNEPPTSTTNSANIYFNNDDDTLMINDSQSSGNLSPQRQSSFVCSQSSIHPEETSLS